MKPDIVQRYEEQPDAYFDPVEMEDIFHYYAELGEHDRLQPIIQRSLILHPDDPSTILMQAEYALNLGDADDCLRILEPIFQEENPYFCILKASALAKKGAIEEALEWAETAWSAGDPLIGYDLGVGFTNAQQEVLALRYFMRCHEALPNDIRTLQGILFCLSREGSPEEIILYADKAIELDSFCWEAWLYKGIALTGLGKEEEAIECYDYVIALQPDSLEAYVRKATSLVALERIDEASTLLSEANVPSEGAEAANYHLLKAYIYELQDNRPESEAAIWKAIEANPLNDEVIDRAISAFQAINATKSALPFLQSQYDRGDRSPYLLATLGDILHNEGRYDEAIEIYVQLNKILPSTATAGILAGMYMAQGRFRKAYKLLKEQQEEEPMWQTYILMAVCCYEEDWNTAMQDNFTLAYCLNQKAATDMLQNISEEIYRYFEVSGVFAAAETYRQTHLSAKLSDAQMAK